MEIIYDFIDHKENLFKEVMELRYAVLFEGFHKVEKYKYDKLDSISKHIVALDNGKVVGYSRFTNKEGKGEITNVVVDPNYSGKGIGYNLIKNILAISKEDNINYLYLHSRLGSVGFYEKLGFESTGFQVTSEKTGLQLEEMHIHI